MGTIGRVGRAHLRQGKSIEETARELGLSRNAVPPNVLALPRRSRCLHAGVGLGEGPGREPGRSRPRALLHAEAAVQDLRRTQRLASGPVHRLRQGPSPSRAPRANGLGGLRGGAAQARRLSWPLRRVPCAAGLGVEDVPGSVRQQQILGERQRRRPPRRDPRLRRAHRHPAGRPHRRASIPANTVAARRSTIPGITCRCWRASPAPCATARRSRTGCCRRRWSGCGASSPDPTTAIARWSPFSPPCSPMDCRRSKPPAPRRSPRASIPPTSSSTSSRADAIPDPWRRSSPRKR